MRKGSTIPLLTSPWGRDLVFPFFRHYAPLLPLPHELTFETNPSLLATRCLPSSTLTMRSLFLLLLICLVFGQAYSLRQAKRADIVRRSQQRRALAPRQSPGCGEVHLPYSLSWTPADAPFPLLTVTTIDGCCPPAGVYQQSGQTRCCRSGTLYQSTFNGQKICCSSSQSGYTDRSGNPQCCEGSVTGNRNSGPICCPNDSDSGFYNANTGASECCSGKVVLDNRGFGQGACCASTSDNGFTGSDGLPACCPSGSTVFTPPGGFQQACCSASQSGYTDGNGSGQCCEGSVTTNRNTSPICCSIDSDTGYYDGSTGATSCCSGKVVLDNRGFGYGACCSSSSDSGFTDNNGLPGCCPSGSSVFTTPGGSQHACCTGAQTGFTDGSGNARCCEGSVTTNPNTSPICCLNDSDTGFFNPNTGAGECCSGKVVTDIRGSNWGACYSSTSDAGFTDNNGVPGCCPSGSTVFTADNGFQQTCCSSAQSGYTHPSGNAQ